MELIQILEEAEEFAATSSDEELDEVLAKSNYSYWKDVGPFIDPLAPIGIPWEDF